MSNASCKNCDHGHRRVDGFHVPTQRKGMIPVVPCDAIVAVFTRHFSKFGYPNQAATWSTGRRWSVRVDGEALRTKSGVVRAWFTKTAALKAGRKASPYKEAL